MEDEDLTLVKAVVLKTDLLVSVDSHGHDVDDDNNSSTDRQRTNTSSEHAHGERRRRSEAPTTTRHMRNARTTPTSSPPRNFFAAGARRQAASAPPISHDELGAENHPPEHHGRLSRTRISKCGKKKAALMRRRGWRGAALVLVPCALSRRYRYVLPQQGCTHVSHYVIDKGPLARGTGSGTSAYVSVWDSC
ncbi:hypothetical protein HPB47_012312 [Ixodes persulcatus]|uniref:Uncharacterized protein n=1 Tax=Ixodes persulcatus TaxID=34615 RepID=A0AC60NTX8_IXOPE|nr:hypothetical protein HPB47_012312 [Ixodes persulcatus]